MLREFRGKKIVVVGQQRLLTPDCHAQLLGTGATVVGPVSSLSEASRLLEVGDVDAAIVDLALDEPTIVHLATLLEAMALPFVFVSSAGSGSSTYFLSGNKNELRDLADVLFGPPGPGSTLH